MGNSCTKNTIIEKSNENDRYVYNKNKIYYWPEFQFKNDKVVTTILQDKGYYVIRVDNSKFINSSTAQYNRVILYCENNIVKKIPSNG
jgi:hypothetical protein